MASMSDTTAVSPTFIMTESALDKVLDLRPCLSHEAVRGELASRVDSHALKLGIVDDIRIPAFRLPPALAQL